jgi:hypothetical protein
LTPLVLHHRQAASDVNQVGQDIAVISSHLHAPEKIELSGFWPGAALASPEHLKPSE